MIKVSGDRWKNPQFFITSLAAENKKEEKWYDSESFWFGLKAKRRHCHPLCSSLMAETRILFWPSLQSLMFSLMQVSLSALLFISCMTYLFCTDLLRNVWIFFFFHVFTQSALRQSALTRVCCFHEWVLKLKLHLWTNSQVDAGTAS